MNEMANLADTVGADIEAVRRGIGSDPRIGYHFLYAGVGYGGSCFPKDVQALIRTGSEMGHNLRILEAVEEVNHEQKEVLVRKVTGALGEDLSGRTFAMWGLSFKPNTDDMREAPSRRVIAQLLARGATVRAYDPVATTEAKRVLAMDLRDTPELAARLSFSESHMEAVQSCDALIVATEWTEFKSPDFSALARVMKTLKIFDGRNLYDPNALSAAGIEYHSIGRQSVVPRNLR
jgi:UDPglucose 6-dehydrogenase